MKTTKRVIFSSLLILTLAAAASVFAASDVRFTVHNLSNNNDPLKGIDAAGRYFYSSQVDQVCIFCHTPHNASPATPLWNKSASLTTANLFRLYTSSSTLTPTTKASHLTAASPSMLCLGCHDGKTAVNVLHNSVVGSDATGVYAGERLVDIGGVNSPVTIQDFAFGTRAAANLGSEGTNFSKGDNLTDDHPIGFNYAAAQSTSPATQAALRDPATIATNTPRIRFFGGNMECSTCHDPHVKYNPSYGGGDPTLAPFLVMSNTGSALCLACHNK